jgi:phosphonopyruvate decarboxylase
VLDPARVYASLLANRIEFFAGVPDSLLKDMCAYITDHADPAAHVIAANEGSAIALAAGHFLATGEAGLVYLQNSGLGNTINPLLSIADPEVYAIPMLLLIGWRGEPDVADEPQHVKQGRVTPALLDSMDIPYEILDSSLDDAGPAIAAACRAMRERSGPSALLVRAGAFGRYASKPESSAAYPLTREGALDALLPHVDPRGLLVSTTGKTSRELYEYRVRHGEGHGRDFLTVGSMGHASQIALGVALRRPDLPVYCIDGDGAVIMHMGSLAIIGARAPANFLHVVINNGAHDSVGGQPTVGFDMDLIAIALACGYRSARRAGTAEEVVAGMRALAHGEGPAFLEIRARKGAREDLGRPATSPLENRDQLMAWLRGRGPGHST